MPKRLYPRALIYEQLCGERLLDPLRQETRMGRHHDEDGDGLADHDRPAETAGEQDHTDPWAYAGEPADAPTDPGGDDDGVA